MFTGKNALITGGVRGIGLEIGKTLLRNKLEKLFITDIIDDGGVIQKLRSEFPKKKITFEKFDINNRLEMFKIYKKVFLDFDNFDIVCNNAGLLNDLNVELTILTNVAAVINSSMKCMKLMSKEMGGRGGYILNIASTAGLGPTYFAPVYSSSKWAVVSFTRCMGYNDYYLNKTGVKYMAICPGCTKTNLFHNFSDKVIMKDLKPVIDNEIMGKFIWQDIATVGKCVLQALSTNKNGAIFICDCNVVKEVVLNELTQELVTKNL